MTVSVEKTADLIGVELNEVQKRAAAGIEWLLDPCGVSQGRTTLLAIAYITRAIRNPNQIIRVFDISNIEPSKMADRMLTESILRKVARSTELNGKFKRHDGNGIEFSKTGKFSQRPRHFPPMPVVEVHILKSRPQLSANARFHWSFDERNGIFFEARLAMMYWQMAVDWEQHAATCHPASVATSLENARIRRVQASKRGALLAARA